MGGGATGCLPVSRRCGSEDLFVDLLMVIYPLDQRSDQQSLTRAASMITQCLRPCPNELHGQLKKMSSSADSTHSRAYWTGKVDPRRKLSVSASKIAVEQKTPEACLHSVPSVAGAKIQALRKVSFTPSVYTQFVKPAGDRIIALCALAVCAIPMLLIAAVVVLAMGRPIFFQQRRVGLQGQIFNVLKFRTMGMDRRFVRVRVPHEHRINHKSDDDPRHTTVGRILRRLSLDELPQLFNVLRGEMSLVGPRPELESVVARHYPENLHQRHLVRPGLTGMWQISARGSGPMHENGEWDLEYIEQISFLTDLKIICKTPFAMFGQNRGN